MGNEKVLKSISTLAITVFNRYLRKIRSFFLNFEFVDKKLENWHFGPPVSVCASKLRADLVVRLVPGTFLASDSQPEYRDTKGCR
jgi:hypothetical protein